MTEGPLGGGFEPEQWPRASEFTLWEGRSTARGLPVAPAVVLLVILLGAGLALTTAHSESPTFAIATGLIGACFIAGLVFVEARRRELDRYVVTNRRAAIVRRGRVVMEVPITSSKLAFRASGDHETGTVEWGPGKSRGWRLIAQQLGLLSNDMTFTSVDDIEGLAVIVRNARTNLGVETPDVC